MCGLLVGPSDHGLLRVHVIRQVSVLISKPPLEKSGDGDDEGLVMNSLISEDEQKDFQYDPHKFL